MGVRAADKDESSLQSAKGTKLNKRGIETRQKLLTAAVEVLVEAKLTDVSANLVAKRAGVTWGTLQHHFGEADGLWAAVLDFLAKERPMLRPAAMEESVTGRVAQIINGLSAAYDTRPARAVWNLRGALPPDTNELSANYPLTAAAFAEWDLRWRKTYSRAFQGLVVDAYRLERIRNLLPAAVRGLSHEQRLGTWTDVDEAREGLIDAVAQYLHGAPSA